jgi:hypothetical protein
MVSKEFREASRQQLEPFYVVTGLYIILATEHILNADTPSIQMS